MTDANTPTTPKFERQLQLEKEMQGMGIARFRAEVQKAQENGLESTTHGVLSIMKQAFDPFEATVKEWKSDCVKGKTMWGGKTPQSYGFIKDVGDDVLVYLTMKTIMDTISKARTLPDVTLSIASQIQNEINFKEFKKESPAHYKKVKEDVSKRTRKLSHISTVIKRSAAKDDVDLTKFSQTDKHKIGSLLLSLFIESTGLVEIYSPPQMPGERKRKPIRVQPTAKTTEWLRGSNARCELLSPVILPMIIEPKDWTSPVGGGFWSDFIKTSLVRRTTGAYLDEMENMDMWEVYQSVNHLQKTKWKINNNVLEVIRSCADNNNPLGKLPAGGEAPLPPLPVDIDTNKEARWLWRKQAAGVHGENVRSRSKYIGLQKKLQIAERFTTEEELFFVYTVDFRGRVYPAQIHLNPQGDDVAKSLLHFAEGKPVDDESGGWLALHGANTFGYDKANLQDRVQWVLDNTENICASASDPFVSQWWAEADKPWQFLAFCYEWKEFQDSPDTFVSHLPIALDGSCNGLQNFSAMLRDPIGGRATNLTPTEEPCDIYQEVAELVIEKLKEDIANGVEYSQCWEGFISRKLVKRPTMTMPYGATLAGYRQQIAEVVKKWRDDGEPSPIFEDHGFHECFYLARLIQSSLGEVVVAAETAMKWLQDVAKIIGEENLPIYWVTPVGFPVMQNYRNILTKSVETQIAGRLYYGRVAYSNGTKMNKRKMKAAIAPNFVHSCDAAHLIRTINLAETNDINALAMVHDSFGTHAADTPALTEILRHAFVQVHKEEPLESFYKQICRQSSTPERIPKPPKKGSLDLEQVLEADFFFS